jgi:hypothetical protein
VGVAGHLSAIDPFRRLSPPVNLDAQLEGLPKQPTFLGPFLLTDVNGVQPAGTYIIENKDKTHDNLSFIAYRPVFLPGSRKFRRAFLPI